MYFTVSLTAFTIGFVSYLRTQIEVSSIFVYEYKMSTGGRSARDLYLAQEVQNDSDAHAGVYNVYNMYNMYNMYIAKQNMVIKKKYYLVTEKLFQEPTYSVKTTRFYYIIVSFCLCPNHVYLYR